MKKEYNWWDDPKNKDIVDELSWWEKEENKSFLKLPISIIKDEDREVFVVGSNKETDEKLGKGLSTVSEGSTLDEATSGYFENIKTLFNYFENTILSYKRFVPFIKGNWKMIGGTWIIIFGIHFYFRYGKNMKHGFYIPFTKLNIMITNYWKLYNKRKKKKSKL